MYSRTLEILVQSAIADGVVTDKDRAVLHKKAAEEGVGEKDIDTYVNRLIASQPVSASTMGLGALERVEEDYNIYYRMKHPFELIVDEDSPMSRWYINLIYIERSRDKSSSVIYESEESDCEGWIGVQSYGFLKNGPCGDPEAQYGKGSKSIIIETQNKKIRITTQLPTIGNEYVQLLPWRSGFPISGIKYQKIESSTPDFGDEGKLELNDLLKLCEATSIRFFYKDFVTAGKRKHHGAIVGRPRYDFAAFAQLFYHAVLDVTAYPDAEKRLKDSIEQWPLLEAEAKRKEEERRRAAEEEKQRLEEEAKAHEEALRIARQEEWDKATTSGKIWLLSKRLWKEFIVIHWKGILLSLFILYCLKGCYDLMV